MPREKRGERSTILKNRVEGLEEEKEEEKSGEGNGHVSMGVEMVT